MTVIISAAPRIDRSTLKDMTIKAGQNIRFDVKISGEPPPSKSWFLNKARLDSKDDITIDNEDYKTKLVIMPVSRKHSGTYVIKAENSSGKDEVAVEVTVLGMFFSFLTSLLSPSTLQFVLLFFLSSVSFVIINVTIFTVYSQLIVHQYKHKLFFIITCFLCLD